MYIHYSLHWFACNVHNVNVHNWCAQCEFDIKFEYKLNGSYSKHIDVTALPVYKNIYQNSTIELRRVLKPPWNGCLVKLLLSCAACGRYGNTCTQIFVAIICHHMDVSFDQHDDANASSVEVSPFDVFFYDLWLILVHYFERGQ